MPPLSCPKDVLISFSNTWLGSRQLEPLICATWSCPISWLVQNIRLANHHLTISTLSINNRSISIISKLPVIQRELYGHCFICYVVYVLKTNPTLVLVNSSPHFFPPNIFFYIQKGLSLKVDFMGKGPRAFLIKGQKVQFACFPECIISPSPCAKHKLLFISHYSVIAV